MLSPRKTLPWQQFLGLFLLCIWAVRVQGQRVCRKLKADEDACPVISRRDSLFCAAKQNSVFRVMNCVQSSDRQLCRSRDQDDDDYDAWLNGTEAAGDICLAPREILLVNSIEICPECKLTGAIRACPREDPDFYNCLCEQQMTLHHMKCLAACFMPDPSVKSLLPLVCESFSGGAGLKDLKADMAIAKAVDASQARATSSPSRSGFNSTYWALQQLPRLSYSYYSTDDQAGRTFVVGCTVHPMSNSKDCTQTPFTTPTSGSDGGSSNNIYDREPTGLNYASQATTSVQGTTRPNAAAPGIALSKRAMAALTTLCVYLMV